jgi:hypothetical protein
MLHLCKDLDLELIHDELVRLNHRFQSREFLFGVSKCVNFIQENLIRRSVSYFFEDDSLFLDLRNALAHGRGIQRLSDLNL